MILVTSAAGRTGRHMLDSLAARGLPTRAFVRRPVEGLSATERFVGDLLSRDDLGQACQGVEAVVHNGPISRDEPAMGRWAIEAAKAAGVRHFVYLSVTHPQTEWLLNHRAKLAVEDRLIDSGLPFTILQPMHYFQNIDVRAACARGVYASAYSPQVPLSFVDIADLAEVVAGIVGDPHHHFATYEICGADHLNTDQIAAVLTERSGRTVRNQTLSVDELVAHIPGAQTSYLGDMLIRLMTYYRRYGIRGNPNILAWLLGRPPTSFAAYVDRCLARPDGQPPE